MMGDSEKYLRPRCCCRKPTRVMKKIAPPSDSPTDVLEVQPSGPRRKTKNRMAEMERLRREEANGHSDANYNEILRALTALKKGHFTERLRLHWSGVQGKISDVFNDLAELMEHSTQDLSRISRVVGREGKLTERLPKSDAVGDWARRIESVNTLIDSLVLPVSETARVIGAVAKGDLSQTMSLEIEGRKLEGEFLRTAKTVNTMVDQLGAFASEVTRVAREVGTEGKLGGQAKVKGVSGTWKDLTDNVNLMAANLTSQVRNIATVTTAVANGDLT